MAAPKKHIHTLKPFGRKRFDEPAKKPSRHNRPTSSYKKTSRLLGVLSRFSKKPSNAKRNDARPASRRPLRRVTRLSVYNNSLSRPWSALRLSNRSATLSRLPPKTRRLHASQPRDESHYRKLAAPMTSSHHHLRRCRRRERSAVIHDTPYRHLRSNRLLPWRWRLRS